MLKPEMFATFRIITGDGTMSPAVPESAVVYEGDSARVWVARDDGAGVVVEDGTGGCRSGIAARAAVGEERELQGVSKTFIIPSSFFTKVS